MSSDGGWAVPGLGGWAAAAALGGGWATDVQSRNTAVQHARPPSDFRVRVVSELHVSVVTETRNSVPSLLLAMTGPPALLASPPRCLRKNVSTPCSSPSLINTLRSTSTSIAASQPNMATQPSSAELILPAGSRVRTAPPWPTEGKGITVVSLDETPCLTGLEVGLDGGVTEATGAASAGAAGAGVASAGAPVGCRFGAEMGADFSTFAFSGALSVPGPSCAAGRSSFFANPNTFKARLKMDGDDGCRDSLRADSLKT